MVRGLFVFLGLSVWSLFAIAANGGGAPKFQRIVIVVLENDDIGSALEQPFMARLAREGVLFEDYRAVAHPSYPNYIAMTSGSTWGIDHNSQVNLGVSHLGDLLEARGKSWKMYAEDFPGHCFLGAVRGLYARRHAPFLSYRNVQTDPVRCARVVEAGQFKVDLETRQLPDYSLYIPNNRNNGHDTGVAYADRWLERTFEPLLRDARFRDGTLFVVTFDEDDSGHRNRVYTAFWGDMVVPGTRVSTRYTHYSLLRTIEDVFGLGTLGKNDATAQPIREGWRERF